MNIQKKTVISVFIRCIAVGNPPLTFSKLCVTLPPRYLEIHFGWANKIVNVSKIALIIRCFTKNQAESHSPGFVFRKGRNSFSLIIEINAPVAQLDRASDYGSEG